MKRRKKALASRFNDQFGATVAYGLFKGMKLSPDSWWGKSDRGSMLFGLYEEEVLQSLVSKPEGYRTFIDIGAADGYYAVGALLSKQFDEVICFEVSDEGRRVIRQNAERNGVGDNIIVFGEATRDGIAKLPRPKLDNALILVDIEGAEFELFDRDLFKLLKQSILIVEIHDFAVADGARALSAMKAAASEFFDITEFKTSARDLSKFPELHELSDMDRWLLCSESRPCLMTWLRFDPKGMVGGDGLEPPTLSV
jgi:predicted O-methyltransferase YrrM